MKEEVTMLPEENGYRQYQFLGGVSLLALFLLLLQNDAFTPNPIIPQYLLVLSFGVLMCGGLGLLAQRPINPLFALILLGANQLLFHASLQHRSPHPVLRPAELAMAVATLGYLASHYRLLSLRFQALPPDARRPDGTRRPDRLATPLEVVLLVAQLPFYLLVGCALWLILMGTPVTSDLTRGGMQFVLVAWLLAVGLFVAAGFFGGWRRRQLGPEGGRLMLQDILWQQLGGEQRTLYRRLARSHVPPGDPHDRTAPA